MSIGPRRIGKYELRECVGRGGMGEVWKAFDTQLLRYVAFKLIRAELQSDPHFIRRFQREAQVIASLHHPNIVKIFDFQISQALDADDPIYMVMDYIEGQTLSQYINSTIRTGKFPSADDIVQLFVPISMAIDYAHHKGMIHRDIKPSNILLDKALTETRLHTDSYNRMGEPILTDFGIAKILGSASITLGGWWLGTPHYTAPEQSGGYPDNKCCDLYSLGIILYEICTGVLPFDGDSPAAILMQHIIARPLSPTLINPNISPALNAVILRSIARDPADRFPSASSMAVALCEALNKPASEDLRQIAQLSEMMDRLAEPGPWPASESMTSTSFEVIRPLSMRYLPSTPSSNVPAGGGSGIRAASPNNAPVVGTSGAMPAGQSANNGSVMPLPPPPMQSGPQSFMPQKIVTGEGPDRRVEYPSHPVVERSSGSTRMADTPATAKVPTVINRQTSKQQLSPGVQAANPMPTSGQPYYQQVPVWSVAAEPTRPISPRWSRGKRIRNSILILLTIGLTTAGLTFFLLVPRSGQKTGSTRNQKTPTVALPNGIGVTRAPDGEYIGVSDGTFAFDTQRRDRDLKMQAAEQLSAGNYSSADSLWQEAVTEDTNDAETLIYMEDRRILDAGDPYITVVVGTTLTGNASTMAMGREATQAAYVAQREYNTAAKLPGGLMVRILMANSGEVATYTTAVARQIAQLAQKDRTIVAVMGWTSTATTLNALGVLSSAKIPMVTNSGADVLTGRSPYFFRVTPPASVSGRIGAIYAEQRMHARTAAVFVDVKNNYVLGLANGFTSRFIGDGNTIVATENYTVGVAGTLPALLRDALSKHPDILYFAGYPADAGVILAHLQPADPLVLGGSSLYQLGGYPAAAQKSLSHLRFTAYSYPDEWDILEPGVARPAFFADYKLDYDPNNQHAASPYEYDRPDGTTMELYDAISVMLYGCSIALAGRSTITGHDLQHALTQVTGNQAFQGVTSQIAFGADSNPIDRAIVLICVDKGNFFKMDGVYGKFMVGEADRAQVFTPSACS